MEGIIQFLCSLEEEEAEFLRLHCIFKLIPMINPDGVINGNYRTGINGVDLNRSWMKPN
jgi:murein tripeptide amidase MpaA